MNVSEIMQYLSYLMIAIGAMAFLVSAVTQVIKSWPGLDKLPTPAVVIVLSLVLCPACLVALLYWQGHPIEWYMVFACVLAAFFVALVAMDGWERLKEIWDRTGYKNNQQRGGDPTSPGRAVSRRPQGQLEGKIAKRKGEQTWLRRIRLRPLRAVRSRCGLGGQQHPRK